MIRTKKKLNTFVGGIDQDTIVTKFSDTHYFDAQNMRIITNDSSEAGGSSSVKGNIMRLQFAAGDKIIGFCKIRSIKAIDRKKDSIVFFVHNNNSPSSRIYLFEGDPNMLDLPISMDDPFAQHTSVTGYVYKSGYIYRNDGLNFQEAYPIKAEGRYESDEIRKVYWVDGLNEIRYMILDRVDPLDSPEIFSINPLATLPEPSASIITGGAYKAGRVQYAYQLYIRNGAATTYSPASNMLNLTAFDAGADSRTYGGTEFEGETGKGAQIVMTNLDPNYNRIRLVAIYYTQYLQDPVVNIVAEAEYLAGEITLIDNGLTILGTVPIAEFRLFGQTNYIANYIATKNNYLFFADIIEDKWNPDWLNPLDDQGDPNPTFFDTRAVRFRKYLSGGGPQPPATQAFGVGGSSLRHGVAGVTFWNYDDDILGISIPDITTALSFPGGRTITGVTNVQPFDIDAPIFDISWDDNTLPTPITTRVISPMGDLCDVTIQPGPTFPAMLITIKQLFGGNIFNMATFANMSAPPDNSDVFAINVTYTYTLAPGFVIDAGLDDTSLYHMDMDAPVDPTVPADWYAVDWYDPAVGPVGSVYVPTHNGINIYNNIDNDYVPSAEYKFLSDGVTLGAEGPNTVVTFDTEAVLLNENTNNDTPVLSAPYVGTPIGIDRLSSQRTETYRMWIVFFNTKMQYSNPQWICDLRMPFNDDINLLDKVGLTSIANYIYPKVELRSMPVDDELLGWQVFRCERGNYDRTVMANGIISPCQTFVGGPLDQVVTPATYYIDPVYYKAENIPVTAAKDLIEISSPEICFNKNLKFSGNDQLRVDGRYDEVLEASQAENNNFQTFAVMISTGPTSALDVRKYDMTDGFLFSPAHITGDPPVYPDTYPAPRFLNGKKYLHVCRYDDGGGNDYYGDRGFSYVGVSALNDFDVDPLVTGLIYGSYLRNAFLTQYGGNTYEARSYNQVIPYSPFVLKATLENVCTFGDTFITMFAYLRACYSLITGGATTRLKQEMIFIPCESSINTFLRTDQILKFYKLGSAEVILQNTFVDGLAYQPNSYPAELGDLYRYNSVYSKTGSALKIQVQPFDSLNIEDSDVKIMATEQKTNNEYWDSWTNLYTNNFIEVDPKFGGIRNIFNFNNRLFAGQDKGISVLGVADRSLIQDNVELQLVLGTGGILERFDYLTVTSGFQNYFDMGLSDKGMYYIDRRAKTFYNLSTEQADMPISELKGYRSFMKKYLDISEVKTGYDPVFKEFFFYVSDGIRDYNSTYGELTAAFIGKHTFIPDRMFSLNDQFYTAKDNAVWIHNQGAIGIFYGQVSDSFIEMIINPESINVCRFDILDLRVDVTGSDGVTLLRDEQFDAMVLSNNYQTTSKTLLWSGDDSAEDTNKNIIGKWRTWVLPDDQESDFYRFTDTYLKVKLIKNNIPNHAITLHDITTFYRPTKN